MNIANSMPNQVPAETSGNTQYGEESSHIWNYVKLINARPGIHDTQEAEVLEMKQERWRSEEIS